MIYRLRLRRCAPALLSALLGSSIVFPLLPLHAAEPAALAPVPVLATTAQGDAPTFDIPSQSLATGLAAFAEQSGWQVFYSSDLADGLSTTAVSGAHQPEDALQSLLAGTGVTYRITGANSVTIDRADVTPAPVIPRAPASQPPSSLQGNGQDRPSTPAKPVKVPEIVVKDVQDRDYNPENSTTATKTDTPIQLTPATVNIVTRELLLDRQPRAFVEALRTVPGINATSSRITTQNMLSRGFSLRQAGGEFRNGLRHFDLSNLAPEIANVERFELLKGPSSVLYGINGLGGALNVITKTPQPVRQGMLQQSFGTWNYYRTAADVGGPMDKDGNWSWRLNGSFERTQHFQDFVNQEIILANPSFAWRPSPDTSLVFDFEFLRANYHGNVHGLPADGTALASPIGHMPISRSIYDPNFNHGIREQYYAGYQFDHRFNDSLSLHQGFLWAKSDQPVFVESNMIGFVGGFTGDRRLVQRRVNRTDEGDQSSITLDTNVLGKFATGPIRHELLAGFDFYRSESVFAGSIANLPNLDLLNPVYRVQPTSPFTKNADTRTVQQWGGVYVQETLIPWEPLRIVLAGRTTFIETDTNNRLNASLSRAANDVPFTPRFGVVYTPLKPISLFASYSESFVPRTGITFGGAAFTPEKGVSYEAGVKTSLLGGQVSSTVAAFSMTRSNVVTNDPANPGFSLQTGEQRSQGVEWDLLGSPVPGWDVAAAFTWLDLEVTKDNTFLAGQRTVGAPKFSASLWNTYMIQDGPLRGLGGGFGIFYEGKRYGQLVTAATAGQAFNIPGYVRGDVALFYRQKRYEIQVNINNVTNENYFSGVLSRTNVYPGEPLNVIATLRLPFSY